MEAKAKAFTEFVEKFNANTTDTDKHWNVLTVTKGDRTTTTAIRNDETLTLIWFGTGEVYDYPNSAYSRKGTDWAVRNVSEGRRLINGTASKGTATGTKRESSPKRTVTTTASKAAAEADTDDVPAPAKRKAKATRTAKVTDADAPEDTGPKLPFKLDDPDDVILNIVADRYVTWRKGAVKMVRKAHKTQHLKITLSAKRQGVRMLNFADDAGFYALDLDNILEVK